MNILITRHDKIGDFITTLPMAKILKEQTNYKIVFLISKINEPLAKNLPFIDDIIIYSKDTKKLVQEIKSKNVDISISGFVDTHLGWCLFLSGIKTRIAPATKLAQIFFNNTLKQRRSEVKKTEWQYNLDLLRQCNKNIDLTFTPPLLTLDIKRDSFIILHTGSGGSTDGNLILKDYIKLAKTIKDKVEIIFTFGPDDKKIKQETRNYIKKENLDIQIKDNFKDIWEFTQFIAKSKLFISTSTGPMHLAGLTNTPTLSFFGENLFASSKRWSTISNKKYQNNFELPLNYTQEFYDKIETRLMEILTNDIQ